MTALSDRDSGSQDNRDSILSRMGGSNKTGYADDVMATGLGVRPPGNAVQPAEVENDGSKGCPTSLILPERTCA